MAHNTSKQKKPKRNVSKWQRIAAIVGICILLLLYLLAVICAFIDHPLASSLLWSALFCTLVIPVLIYAFQICLKHFGPEDDETHSRS